MSERTFYKNEHVSFFDQDNKLTQGRYIGEEKNKYIIKLQTPISECVKIEKSKVYKNGEAIML